jgi:hypothetical protein
MKLFRLIVFQLIVFLLFISCIFVGTGYDSTQIPSDAPIKNPAELVPTIPTSHEDCNQGYHWENGQYVLDQLASCLQGYHWENGQCVPDQPASCLQGYHWENGQCVPDHESDKTDSCISSGGIVKTRMCCGTEDFPNTCLIGPCGCNPEISNEVKVCDCGKGMCFDGTSCVSTCRKIGKDCDSDSQCCSGFCDSEAGICVTQPCKNFGENCNYDYECCSLYCDLEMGKCHPPPCKKLYDKCESDSQCCSGSICKLGECIPQCTGDFNTCKDSSQCCSGFCDKGGGEEIGLCIPQM